MSTNIEFSSKAAIAIKTARTALGVNQVEFARMLSIPKTSLARIETLEAKIDIDVFYRAVEVLRERGIDVKVDRYEDITIVITPKAQQLVLDLLADESNRRSDRKKRLHLPDED